MQDLFICAKDLFIAAINGKAPAIHGQGKLAERIEVEFGPFRPAASRRAECLLVALPPSGDLLFRAKDLFVAASRATETWYNSPLHE